MYFMKGTRRSIMRSIDVIVCNGVRIACLEGEEPRIADVETVLDLMMAVKYEHKSVRLVVNKAAFADEIFILSSGLAGEIFQKFITYQVKLAIWGDFSKYTSKPLKDFLYESNQGKDILFFSTKEEAITQLSKI